MVGDPEGSREDPEHIPGMGCFQIIQKPTGRMCGWIPDRQCDSPGHDMEDQASGDRQKGR